jgi:hypothetical protein
LDFTDLLGLALVTLGSVVVLRLAWLLERDAAAAQPVPRPSVPRRLAPPAPAPDRLPRAA